MKINQGYYDRMSIEDFAEYFSLELSVAILTQGTGYRYIVHFPGLDLVNSEASAQASGPTFQHAIVDLAAKLSFKRAHVSPRSNEFWIPELYVHDTYLAEEMTTTGVTKPSVWVRPRTEQVGARKVDAYPILVRALHTNLWQHIPINMTVGFNTKTEALNALISFVERSPAHDQRYQLYNRCTDQVWWVDTDKIPTNCGYLTLNEIVRRRSLGEYVVIIGD